MSTLHTDLVEYGYNVTGEIIHCILDPVGGRGAPHTPHVHGYDLKMLSEFLVIAQPMSDGAP
jgi:hypothetical protein